MMKKSLLIAMVVTLGLSACGNKHRGGKELVADKDTLSYYIGLDFGSQLLRADSSLNIQAISAGLLDYFEGKTTVTTDEIREWFTWYNTEYLPNKNQRETDNFFTELDNTNKHIQKSESGLVYEIIRPGSDERPTDDNDTVQVGYKGYFVNGKMFEESGQDTASFRLSNVIRGWTEGIKLVGKGGRIKLYLRPDLAYGAYGSGPIGPNMGLIFDVELYDFTPMENTAN
jgi:FKBP-type peptidyl-prolyl cis-trans isomerase